MLADRSLIDVIIPIYNVERTIAQSIGSVVSQTIQSFRIFVIDDGSTDQSAKIVRELAERDARIILLTKSNSGIVDALNLGLKHATADFIARLDGDDVCDRDRFEVQLEYLERHPDCVAVSCNARLIDENGEPMEGVTRFGDLNKLDPYHAPAINPNISHPFLFLRREAIQKIGFYRHVYHAEDVDLYWRLQHIGRIHGLESIHGSYRVHSNSVTGASILNSRIGSVSAQLAAISEVRHRENKEDITFPASRIIDFHRANSLEGIIDVVSEELSPSERAYLQIATSARFLDWICRRAFKPSSEDCIFVKRSISVNREVVTARNLDTIRYLQILCIVKYAKSRQFKNVAASVDFALFFNIMQRFARRLWLGR